MENYDSLLATLALVLGASWASGINLYAAVMALGMASVTGYVDLPAGMEILSNPLVIGAAGIMFVVEFIADKIPGVDSVWDSLHTFIRIPAGALLATGAIGDVSPAMEVATGILGGSLAATSHFTKAGTRALINTSPEPFSNWGASLTEDIAVLGGLWIALNHPVVFIGLMIVFVLLAIWLLPKIWRLLKLIFRRIGRWLGLVDNTRRAGEVDRLVSSARAGSSRDVDEQLAALNRLHKAGVVTDREFEQGRKRLLRE